MLQVLQTSSTLGSSQQHQRDHRTASSASFSLTPFNFLSSFTTTTTDLFFFLLWFPACSSSPSMLLDAQTSHFGLYEFRYKSSHMYSFLILSVGRTSTSLPPPALLPFFPPFLNHKTSPDSQINTRLHSSQEEEEEEEEEPVGLTDGK